MTDREVLKLLERIGSESKPKEEEIKILSQIRQLSLSNIEVLPNAISNLTGIKRIDIYSSQIKDISALSELKTLTNLSIKDTQISDISVLSKLQSLEYLCLIDTNVKDISALSELTALKRLNLAINNVSSITALSKMFSLTSLSLIDTHVSDISELMGLTALTYLNLSRSPVRILPESITNLRNLQYLDLSYTSISVLPENLGKLPNLKQLILSGNSLNYLPESILTLNMEYKDSILRNDDEYIGIRGMQLKSQPTGLLYQSQKTIEDYYAGPKRAINESKVIFLGMGGVGKTYILKRILNNNLMINETLEETAGVSITFKDYDIEKESYRINFWDFGGMEIMYEMYRCFLTNRTGYVVVLSNRSAHINKDARYWLKAIERFANNAPVIIFVNEWDSQYLYPFDEYSLCRDYPNIKSVIQCSAKDEEDGSFSELEENIINMVLGNDRIGAQLPERLERVKHIVNDLSKQFYYIGQQEYRDICNENGINDENIQQWLLDLFHDLGECLRFKFDDENNRTNDLIILKPVWLVNAIYTFFRECSHLAEYGFVLLERIKLLLSHSGEGLLTRNMHYSLAECDYILKIMGMYKLIYEVPGRDIVFVPNFLRDSAPPDLEYNADSITYEMHYKYLPENVIYNFMIEMYPYLDYERCWRKGFVIDFRRIFNLGLLAVVDISDEYRLRVKVYSFSNHHASELLQEIRTYLLDINDRINIEASEYIIIESHDAFESISIERLLKLKARGEKYYYGDDQDYEIDGLLERVLGSEQVRGLNNYKYFETANTNLSTRGKNLSYEYDLLAMKEALREPPETRLFNSLDYSILSCDTVCKHIISACQQIQINPKLWNECEETRTTQIRDILLMQGFLVRDQVHNGNEKEIMNPGEIDLLVMSNSYDPLTIIEIMNINSINMEYIYHHLNKLLDKDNPTGLKELFLVVFAKIGKKQFQQFWTKYYRCIEGMTVDEFCYVSIEERDTGCFFIKHALVLYDIARTSFLVHHIFVRASD